MGGQSRYPTLHPVPPVSRLTDRCKTFVTKYIILTQAAQVFVNLFHDDSKSIDISRMTNV